MGEDVNEKNIRRPYQKKKSSTFPKFTPKFHWNATETALKMHFNELMCSAFDTYCRLFACCAIHLICVSAGSAQVEKWTHLHQTSDSWIFYSIAFTTTAIEWRELEMRRWDTRNEWDIVGVGHGNVQNVWRTFTFIHLNNDSADSPPR